MLLITVKNNEYKIKKKQQQTNKKWPAFVIRKYIEVVAKNWTYMVYNKKKEITLVRKEHLHCEKFACAATEIQ